MSTEITQVSKRWRTFMPMPSAFLSYSHFDDQHDYGRITKICKLLSAEVKAQTGSNFPIFQDHNDISWGQNWKVRVEESINSVTFLIPFISPSYFRSEWCSKELNLFVKREKELGRDDLILPIYYIDCYEHERLNGHIKKEFQIIASHQYQDWRKKRFTGLETAQLRKAVEHLALQIREALSR